MYVLTPSLISEFQKHIPSMRINQSALLSGIYLSNQGDPPGPARYPPNASLARSHTQHCTTLNEAPAQPSVTYTQPSRTGPGSSQPLPHKLSATPAMRIDRRLPDELVAPDPRQHHGPHEPVDGAGEQDRDADHAVQVVRDVLVDALSGVGRHERRHDEVHVAEQEEHDDGQRGAERRRPRRPVRRARVQVQVQQRARDEDVDDRQRVRDDVEDEVVRVAGRRGEHDDDGHEPVLEEAGERRVEGLVAGPEAREGQDALAPDLLHQPALREDDGEHVAEGGQRDEDRERALGLLAEDVAEEGGGEDAARGDDLLARHGGEVGDVREHVEDGDQAKGERRGDLERAHGVLRLGQGVVRVAVADVRPDDVVQRGDDAVRAARRAGEGVGEVVGLLDAGLQVAREGGEAGADDDEEDDELDDAEEVLQAQAPVQGEAVDQEGGRDAGEPDAALVPAVDLDVRRVQDVLAEDDGVRAGPAEEDDVGGVHGGGEEARLAEDVLEVVLLAAVAREARAELEIDGEAGGGDEHAGDPDEEGEADGAGLGEDGGGGREDAGADHAVEDEEGGREPADVAARVTRDVDIGMIWRVRVSWFAVMG